MLEVRCGPASTLLFAMHADDGPMDVSFHARQAIPAVTERVARGIAAEYPTVRSLWQAYKAARTVEDAQLLLQDIAVCGQHVPIRRRALNFTHKCLHACVPRMCALGRLTAPPRPGRWRAGSARPCRPASTPPCAAATHPPCSWATCRPPEPHLPQPKQAGKKRRHSGPARTDARQFKFLIPCIHPVHITGPVHSVQPRPAAASVAHVRFSLYLFYFTCLDGRCDAVPPRVVVAEGAVAARGDSAQLRIVRWRTTRGAVEVKRQCTDRH